MKNAKILLIDDDIDDHDFFSIALNDIDQSISCTFANSGVDALKKLQDDSYLPNYIFVDMNMPRMNGRECIVEIRKLDRLAGTPIFMYSTSNDSKIAEEIKRLGATDFIVKPTSIIKLTELLSNLIDQKQ